MTRAPRQKTTLRRVLHWVAGGTVAAQMATMAGLVVFNGVRRRGRRPYRFPTAVSYTHLTLPTILLV